MWFQHSILCFLVLTASLRASFGHPSHRPTTESLDNGTNTSLEPSGSIDNQAETRSEARQRPLSDSSRRSVRLLAILKILQLVHSYSSQHNASASAPSNASESRSVMSWLKSKKPLQRRGNPLPFEPGGLFPSYGPGLPGRHLFPMPLNSGLEKISEPLFLPPFTDTSAIDYWLKFVENAKIDDKMSLDGGSRKQNFGSKSSNDYPKRGKGRGNNKIHSRVSELKPKVQKFQGLYADTGDDYDEDLSLNNDLGSEVKVTGSRKSPKQVNSESETTPRCDKFTDEICIDDFEYPEHAILDEIYKRKDLFQLMYSEVNSDAPLVDGIPRDMDENFSQDYYYGNTDNSDSEDYDGLSNYRANKTEYDFEKTDSSHVVTEKSKQSGGFVCRSEVLYAKPKLAKNIKGKWRVIVNAGDFTQTVRMEKCIRPNSECRFITDNKYESRCAQINSIHRLLVFEKGKGFYIDTFRIPTACTCHVNSMKYPMKQYGNSESLINIKRVKNKSDLGETLWSLLESAKDNPRGENGMFMMPNQREKNSLNLLNNHELLKLLPQLSSVEPESVLQQLLDGYHQYAQRDEDKKLLSDSDLSSPMGSKYATEEEMPHFILPHITRSHNVIENKASDMPSSGMATLVTTPNVGSTRQGTPVVQVIHVPVSTSMISSGPEFSLTSGRTRMHPPPNDVLDPNRFYHVGQSYSKYLTSASINHSQTNSTSPAVNITHMTNLTKENESPSKLRESDTKENNSKTEDKFSDKKINFSYHPILEYIVK